LRCCKAALLKIRYLLSHSFFLYSSLYLRFSPSSFLSFSFTLSLAHPFSHPYSLLPSFICLSSSIFILSVCVPLRTFRREGKKVPERAMRVKLIVRRRSIPSIAVASLTAFHYLITSLKNCFQRIFSLSLSPFLFSLLRCSFPPVCNKNVARLSLYIVARWLHEVGSSASVAVYPPYWPRRSWRSRVVR